MPFPKLLLRKRLWIGVLVLLLVGILYLYIRFKEVELVKIWGKPAVTHFLPSSQLSEDEVTPSPLPEFRWIPLVNISHLDLCRNSQQGHTLIVDELGRHPENTYPALTSNHLGTRPDPLIGNE